MALQVTFVGPLGDAHSLADELIVSAPSAPAHAAAATWAPKASMLTWEGGECHHPCDHPPTPHAVPTARVPSDPPASA